MHRIILSNPLHRAHAHRLIDAAPDRAIMQIESPKRTIPQNDLLWARLSEIAAQKPGGRSWSPELWKAAFMSAFGMECQMIEGLLGEPLPVGFRSSRLSREQMSLMIDFIDTWAAQNGVTLSHWEKRHGAQR